MRRLGQLIVCLLIISFAPGGLPWGVRRTALDLAVLAMAVAGIILILRPLFEEILPKPRNRDRQRRDWFTG